MNKKTNIKSQIKRKPKLDGIRKKQKPSRKKKI